MSGQHESTEARRHEGDGRALVALILAAGASRRMGVSKPLLRDESGQTLLKRAVATSRQAGLSGEAAADSGRDLGRA